MRLKYNFLQILYIFMILVGIFLGFGSTLGYLKNRSTMKEWIVGLIVMGLLPLIFGTILLKRLRKKINNIDKDEIENAIFQLAKKSDSKLTIADVAMNTKLTTEESKKILDEFCLKGFAEIMVSQTGVIVYNFKSIIKESEKLSSEKV
jgi:hypothetical protein